MFTETTSRPAGRLARAASFLSHPLPIDAFVQLVDPLWSSTALRGRIEAIVPETERAATVVIRPGRGWRGHQPGQWVGLGVDIGGVRHHRCYSLTSVPERADGCISVTVQAIPGGLVSNHLVHAARPGTIVHLDQAAGDFTLPARRTRDLLFVTGGSGITPVMGMLRSLDGAGAVGDVMVLHHAPTEAEALFATELARLSERHGGLRVHLTLTGAGAPAPEHELTAATLATRCPDWAEREAWACGPAPLLAAAEAVWADAGRADQLHVERFRPAVIAPGVAGAGGHVRFTRSGRDTVVDGRTPLLHAAEAAGLTPANGCRMGICKTCTVQLVSGSVCDLRDGRITSDEGTHVQICVSAAAGDVELAL